VDDLMSVLTDLDAGRVPLPMVTRQLWYHTGAGMAHLLSTLGRMDWRAEVERGRYLDELLAAELGMGAYLGWIGERGPAEQHCTGV
jgi:hypothetical protein